jgi:sigma-E factor negative regulatory protein RseA
MNPPASRAVPPDADGAVDPSADSPHLSISALADGEAAAVEPACALWRDDTQARERWHTYHLIGDVLRSEELAARPARDAAFLAGLRSRLANEPVLLAPTPQPVTRVRHRWLAPAAVAAGFVAVAGVLVVTRVSAPEAGPQLAAAPAAKPVASLVSAAGGPDQPLVVEGRLIRDARLDSYLRAHREALGSAPAALPGGAPRNVEMLLPVGPGLAPAAASTAAVR